MKNIGKRYNDFILELGFRYRSAVYTYDGFSELVFNQKFDFLEKGIIYYLIVNSKRPIDGCKSIQVKNDGELFQTEVILTSDGKNHVYAKNIDSAENVKNIFTKFLNNHNIPDIGEWVFIGDFDV